MSATPSVPPGVHSIWIINKSGGLVYQKTYADVPTIDTNETLRLASIWHSLHAISAQLSPVDGCTGIELLETENFDLRCIQTKRDRIAHTASGILRRLAGRQTPVANYPTPTNYDSERLPKTESAAIPPKQKNSN